MRWPSVSGRHYQLWEGRAVGSRWIWEPLLEPRWQASGSETRLLLEPDAEGPAGARLLRVEVFASGF